MLDVYIWLSAWVGILIMLIIGLTKIESRIAEDRINKMFEYLKERKVEKIERYIEAERLKRDYAWFGNSKSEQYRHMKATFDRYVDGQPTADVVPVVRCKECRFYNGGEMMCNDTNGFDRWWKPDDFCSYGERRTDDANKTN